MKNEQLPAPVDSRAPEKKNHSRRDILRTGGLLAAALGVGGAMKAHAADSDGEAVEFDAFPKYFPQPDFVPDVSVAGKFVVITVDANGNIPSNPEVRGLLDLFRPLFRTAVPPSLVGDAFAQLLQMSDPLPNVIAASAEEPLATAGNNALLEQGIRLENREAAGTMGALPGGECPPPDPTPSMRPRRVPLRH